MTELVLAIDTSTPRLALALGRIEADGHSFIAGDDTEARGRQASAALSERLHQLMETTGHQPSDLAAVACGVGPGMFTGVRVAIATAKGIALGLGIPAIGVSTLAAVSAPPLPSASPPERLALLDARRGEVYAGRYRVDDAGVSALHDDVCAPLESVLADLDSPVTAIGPGVEVCGEMLDRCPLVVASTSVPGPTSRGLWLATASRWDARTEGSALAAVYLRKSYAELGIHKPKRPFVKSPFID